MATLRDRNSFLEDEYRKLSALKPLVDSYKTTFATLEEEKGNLLKLRVEHEVHLKNSQGKVAALEMEQRRNHEIIETLEERLRDAELGLAPQESGEVLGPTSHATGSNYSNSEGLRRPAYALENEISGLRINSSLALETTSGDASERAIVLEHLLEDEKRRAVQWEENYLKEHQNRLMVENELKHKTDGDAYVAFSPDDFF